MMDQQLVRPVRSRSSRGRKAKHRICRRHVDLRRNHRPTRRLLQDAHMAVLLCYVDPVLSSCVGMIRNKQRYSTGECGQTKFCR